MKKYLMIPLLAAFAATPVLAQETESPYPNRQPAGTGSEAREDNVIRGAQESQEPAIMSEELGTVRSPSRLPAGNEAARHDNVLEGAIQSSEPGLATGRAATDEPPPNMQETGSEGRDENRLPVEAQPLEDY